MIFNLRFNQIVAIAMLLSVSFSLVSCSEGLTDEPSNDVVKNIDVEKLLGEWKATIIDVTKSNGLSYPIGDDKEVAAELGDWYSVEVDKESIKQLTMGNRYKYEVRGDVVTIYYGGALLSVKVLNVQEEYIDILYTHDNGDKWYISYGRSSSGGDNGGDNGGEEPTPDNPDEPIDASQLLGEWRAVVIEREYANGEAQIFVDAESLALCLNGWESVVATETALEQTTTGESFSYRVKERKIVITYSGLQLVVEVVSIAADEVVVKYEAADGEYTSLITYQIVPEENLTYTYVVKGVADKFVTGSVVTIELLDKELKSVGKSFSSEVSDGLGSYEFDCREYDYPYVELRVNGYYFNEVKNDISTRTLTLKAVADFSACDSANVNILTHIEASRIKNLVSSGMNFSAAKEQARSELNAALGLNIGGEFSQLSIVNSTDDDAALIVASALITMERSELELTEYLAALCSSFGESGQFSENLVQQLQADKLKLAGLLGSVRENIINRYESLWTTISVKNLFGYVDWDGDGVAGNEMLKSDESVVVSPAVVDVPNEGGTFTVEISSPIALYLEPQIDIETDTPSSPIVPEDIIYAGLYDISGGSIEYEVELNADRLNIRVRNLQSYIDCSATISLYDYLGNVVASVELQQRGMAVTSEVPTLGSVGSAMALSLASKMAKALSQYNKIEQYYAYNLVEGNLTNLVNNYVYAYSGDIADAWSSLYETNMLLQQIRSADEQQLNAYVDYLNVWSAIYYSNLIYAWGDVPYLYNYDMVQEAQYNATRESADVIFADLKNRLSGAVEMLPEKKNESLKDANGVFFVSKDVARVLLANIYMYEGCYEEAEKLLKEVVDNGYYQLDASTNFMPSGDVNIDITRGSTVSVAESTEVILAFVREGAGSRASFTLIEAGVIPYITLSDVYLSLAECYVMRGDLQNAELCVDSVIRAKNITLSESDTLMKIKEVREKILLYSGTYFAFLKRAGLAEQVCGIESYQLLWPIPVRELNMNYNMTQNPGY